MTLSATRTWADHTGFLRRHLLLLVVAIALGLLGGCTAVLLQSSQYTAQTSLVLAPVPGYVSTATTGRPPRSVTLDTDAQLVRDPAVVAAVARATGQDPTTVRQNLAVSAAPRTRVLHVAFTTGSATTAAAGAEAAAVTLIDVRRRTLPALRPSAAARLDQRMVQLHDQLRAQGRTNPFMVTVNPLATQIALLQARAADLERARTSPAEVIRHARPPARPDSADAEVPLTSGLMTGLLVGCGIGVISDRVRRRRRERFPQFSSISSRSPGPWYRNPVRAGQGTGVPMGRS